MIDWTINGGDIVAHAAVFIGFMVAILKGFGKIALGLRDDVRDIKTSLGTTHPPAGVLGDIHELKHATSRHNEILIQLSASRDPRARTRRSDVGA